MKQEKPKIIIYSHFNKNTVHLMVRLNSQTKVEYLLKSCYNFIIKKNNQNVIKIDFNDIFKFQNTIFFSHRITDKLCIFDYFVMDKGKKSKTAFIFMIITSSKNNFKKITRSIRKEYFEM
mgnify:CR=1 FL=1